MLFYENMSLFKFIFRLDTVTIMLSCTHIHLKLEDNYKALQYEWWTMTELAVLLNTHVKSCTTAQKSALICQFHTSTSNQMSSWIIILKYLYSCIVILPKYQPCKSQNCVTFRMLAKIVETFSQDILNDRRTTFSIPYAAYHVNKLRYSLQVLPVWRPPCWLLYFPLLSRNVIQYSSITLQSDCPAFVCTSEDKRALPVQHTPYWINDCR